MSGSAIRARTGQISALSKPIAAAAPSAARAPSRTKPESSAESSSRERASSSRTSRARQTIRMFIAGSQLRRPASSAALTPMKAPASTSAG